MDASKLREITDRAQKTQAQDFWGTYSISLFAHLQREAEMGSDAVKITNKDQNGLNPHGWLSCPKLYCKVLTELEILGYKVQHSDDARDGVYIYIKW